MFNEQEKNEYWSLTRQCLTEFHGYSLKKARVVVEDFREELESQIATSEAADFIYHDEPFELAQRLAAKQLVLANFEARYDELAEEISQPKPAVTYSKEALLGLFHKVFEVYYQDETRTCDVSRSGDVDRDLYEDVLSTVVRTGMDPLTGSPRFWAPSCIEAAIFLLDRQCRRAFLDPDTPKDKIGQTFQSRAFKLVFRTNAYDEAEFQHVAVSNIHKRALAAYCFLLKASTEARVPSLSLQAHLCQTVAFHAGIPTELLDWTADPTIACLTALKSAKLDGKQATVFFVDFELLSNVVLPPPYAVSQLMQRRIFTAMNQANNKRIFHASCSISFPSDGEMELSPSYPFLPDPVPEELLHLPQELVDLAYDISHKFGNLIDQLDSTDLLTRQNAVADFLARFALPVDSIAAKYDLGPKLWDSLARNWILEIHRYFNDLLMFSSGKYSWVATESLRKLVYLNRDALNIYCKYMMARKGPVFEEKRPLLEGLYKALVQQHPELLTRDIEFIPPAKPVPPNIQFGHYIAAEKPTLIVKEVTKAFRVETVAKDLKAPALLA